MIIWVVEYGDRYEGMYEQKFYMTEEKADKQYLMWKDQYNGRHWFVAKEQIEVEE